MYNVKVIRSVLQLFRWKMRTYDPKTYNWKVHSLQYSMISITSINVLQYYSNCRCGLLSQNINLKLQYDSNNQYITNSCFIAINIVNTSILYCITFYYIITVHITFHNTCTLSTFSAVCDHYRCPDCTS